MNILQYSLFAQNDTKIIKSNNNGLKEKYHVLKSDGTTRDRKYEKYLNGNLIENGLYSNNIKVGIWEFYSFNKLELKYNFDNDSVEYHTINIVNDSMDRPTLFLGSSSEITKIIQTNILYPEDAVKAKKSGKVLITIRIDANGKPIKYYVSKSIFPSLDNEALRVVKLIQPNWLPCIINNKKVESQVTLPVIFRLSNKDFNYLED